MMQRLTSSLRYTRHGKKAPSTFAATVAVAGLLAGCTSAMLENAPADPSQPWKPRTSEAQAGASAYAGSSPDFSVPADPSVTALKASSDINTTRAYGLAELIDIAQSHNPTTQVAWQTARQAALAAGMVEATYLPLITANVIGGKQWVNNALPVPILGRDTETTTISGVSPQIALQWLVFDFGQRSALHEAAKHNSTAANILFNGIHQKIIFDVTRTYYVYGAAQNRVSISRQNLANSQKILAAADARVQKGIGNTVELAQARQAVAQARFGMVQAEGQAQDAYQALLASAGIPPTTTIRIKPITGRKLPADVGAPTERLISAALARRPDVLASLAAAKASQSGIKAAEAEFMPKVFLGAVAADGSTHLSASGLPTLGQQASASGFMIGATMPLFDGGLRAAQLKNAQSVAQVAQTTHHQTLNDAAREIVVSVNTLRSALASYRAASALASAAAVTYDAALESYSAGVGDITVATAADTGLLTARQAQSDAYAASLVAAANLAFMLGSMTSQEAAVGIAGR
ncbi:TolC family protein [Pseudochelatococcus contaminans]|uniref:Protein CyaE n=1 Tax=Pseudochelatococcus contaminans TaxID=1538103 RepID=A0A7W6EES3_9HYPH|nr:TolC family protein [Pseudochelatococcus contaminans]MBB3808341.1 outer membrane protein TolC [Pseudochelatococcus contaminans]